MSHQRLLYLAPLLLKQSAAYLVCCVCVCVYGDQNKATPPKKWPIHWEFLELFLGIILDWYLFLNRSLQITLTNLFLILQNYLRKKGTHPMRMHDNNTTCNRSNQNAGFLDTTNTTWNRSNQNASLPDTHSCSTNQYPVAPDTTKTTCYQSMAQCWKAFLVLEQGLSNIYWMLTLTSGDSKR